MPRSHAHRELEVHEPNSSSPVVITSSRVHDLKGTQHNRHCGRWTNWQFTDCQFCISVSSLTSHEINRKYVTCFTFFRSEVHSNHFLQSLNFLTKTQTPKHHAHNDHALNRFHHAPISEARTTKNNASVSLFRYFRFVVQLLPFYGRPM